MRKIKFRAWFIDTYYYNPKLDFANLACGDYRIKLVNIKFPVSIISSDYDDFLLEQFTGLKDKNGKEIYEGDIIKLSKDADDLYYHPSQNVVVEWDYNYTGFKPFQSTHSDYRGIDNENCEIIGNINENKNLI